MHQFCELCAEPIRDGEGIDVFEVDETDEYYFGHCHADCGWNLERRNNWNQLPCFEVRA